MVWLLHIPGLMLTGGLRLQATARWTTYLLANVGVLAVGLMHKRPIKVSN